MTHVFPPFFRKGQCHQQMLQVLGLRGFWFLKTVCRETALEILMHVC